MSPRLPFLAIVGVVLTGAVFVSQGSGPDDQPAAAGDGLGVAPSATDPGPATWFCVGGTATPKGSADHTVIVANPGTTPLTARLTVVPGTIGTAGAPSGTGEVEREVTVAAGEETTVRLGDLVEAPLASAVVETGAGEAAVEHQVAGPHGTDRAPCSRRSAATWHFAWGATTRDAHELLVLFNPFANDVTVDGVFSTERGIRQPLRWQGLSVPARSLVGVEVGDDVTRREQVAATLRAHGGQLVVDRIQSFDGSAGVTGLDVAAGQPTARTNWVVADGRVDKATTEQVLVYNPGIAIAHVDVNLAGVPVAGEDGPPEPFGVDVRPGRVEALDLQGDPRVPPGVGHALTITSRNGVPVVAEQVTSTQPEPPKPKPKAPAKAPKGHPPAPKPAPPKPSPRVLDARPASPVTSTGWVFAGQTGGRYAVFNPDTRHTAHLAVTMLVHGERVIVPSLSATRLRPGARTELALPTTGPEPGPAVVLIESDHPVVAAPVD